jgi:hypothetical protein
MYTQFTNVAAARIVQRGGLRVVDPWCYRSCSQEIRRFFCASCIFITLDFSESDEDIYIHLQNLFL